MIGPSYDSALKLVAPELFLAIDGDKTVASLGARLASLGIEDPLGWDCFLSYERTQEGLARSMFQALTAAGLRVFFDLHCLAPGERLDTALEAAAQCRAAIVIGQQSWGRSGWAVAEYELLLARCQAEGIPMALVADQGADLQGAPMWLPVVRGGVGGGWEDEALTLVRLDWACGAPLPYSMPGTVEGREALLTAIREASSIGLVDQAGSLARRMILEACRASPRERLDLIRELCAPLLRSSQDALCLDLLGEAWQTACQLGDDRVDIAANLAVVHRRRGSSEHHRWTTEALMLAERSRDEEAIAHARTILAEAALGEGDFQRCVELLEPLRHRWRAGPAPSQSVAVLFNLAAAYRHVDRIDEARALLEELLLRARARPDHVSAAAICFKLGALLDDDDPDSALSWYARSLEHAGTVSDRVNLLRGYCQRAVTLDRVGRAEAALRDLESAQALDAESPLVAWAEGWLGRSG